MKKVFLMLCYSVLFLWVDAQSGLDSAEQVASQQHRLILLNFSGSDWCGPCIRMQKEIFGSQVFAGMADSLLVMVNADFPRNKKNQLAKATRTRNELLADKYNAEGKFPLTILLDQHGVPLKSWDGLPKETAEQFSADIKAIADARK